MSKFTRAAAIITMTAVFAPVVTIVTWAVTVAIIGPIGGLITLAIVIFCTAGTAGTIAHKLDEWLKGRQ